MTTSLFMHSTRLVAWESLTSWMPVNCPSSLDIKYLPVVKSTALY